MATLNKSKDDKIFSDLKNLYLSGKKQLIEIQKKHKIAECVVQRRLSKLVNELRENEHLKPRPSKNEFPNYVDSWNEYIRQKRMVIPPPPIKLYE